MSKLKELVSKGVRLIVTDVPAEGAEGLAASPPPAAPADLQTAPRPKVVMPRKKALTAEEVMADPPLPRTTSAVPAASTAEGFEAVYKEAGITNPGHGYGIGKIADMLESPRLKALGREVKAAAVMAALEAAGVDMKDVIRDAVARDQALDAYEGAKERELAEIRARNEVRAQGIQEEIDAFLKAKNTELEKLKGETKEAESGFLTLRATKRVEEQRLFDTVAHFIEGADNPITTSAPPAPAKPGPTGS
jgi:hypothetical protein